MKTNRNKNKVKTAKKLTFMHLPTNVKNKKPCAERFFYKYVIKTFWKRKYYLQLFKWFLQIYEAVKDKIKFCKKKFYFQLNQSELFRRFQ